MTNKEKENLIKDYFNKILNNTKCELIYSKPYELVICVMLSAQVTDNAVNKITPILFNKYPTLKDLSLARYEDVYSIIKPLGLASSKAKNVILIAKDLLTKFNGEVPSSREELMSLSGVGRKTANVVLLELYNEPVMAVDTHVERVSKRLGISKIDSSVLEVEKDLNKFFLKEDLPKLHHQFIHFGRKLCKAKNPLCEQCELKNICKKSD